MAEDIAGNIGPLSTSVDSLTKSFSSLSNIISSVVSKFSSFASNEGKSITQAISGIGATADKAKAALDSVGSSAKLFGGSLYGLSDSVSKFTSELNSVDFIKFGVGMKVLLDGNITAESALGNTAAAVSNLHSSLTSFSTLGRFLPEGMFKDSELVKVFQSVLATSDAVNKFETSLLEAATAGGNLNSVFGGNLADTEGAMRSVTNSASITADRVGLSFKQSMALTTAIISQLPGEFDKVYENIGVIIDGNSTKLSYSTAELLTQVSRGAQVPLQNVVNFADKMKETYGTSAKGSAEGIAMMSAVAEMAGSKFSHFESIINNLTQSFGLWGDQMRSAGDIFVNVSSALRDSGVGYEGQVAVVKSLTGAIQGLMSAQNMGMRAFIGSGMGGGMVSNALQMEKLMSEEGGMGKVASMMEDKLKQLGGGRVITLNEATEDEGAQRQFLIQRQMLSKMGISDTATANRLMEVMSKGDIGGSVGLDKEKVLAEALGKGEKIQDKQVTLLDKIASNTEGLAQLKQINQRSISNEMLGQENPLERTSKATARYDLEQRRAQTPSMLQNQDVADTAMNEQAEKLKESGKSFIGSLNVNALTKIQGASKYVNQFIEAKTKEYDETASKLEGEITATKDTGKKTQLMEQLEKVKQARDKMMEGKIIGLSPEATDAMSTRQSVLTPAVKEMPQPKGLPSIPVSEDMRRNEPVEATLNIHIYKDDDQLVKKEVVNLAKAMAPTQRGRS